jgi:hypothetical protein
MVHVLYLTLFHSLKRARKKERWPNTTENCGVIIIGDPNKISTYICHFYPYNEWIFKTWSNFSNYYSSCFVLWYLPTCPKRGRYKKTIFDHVAMVTGHRQPREQKFKDECNMQLCPDSVSLDKSAHHLNLSVP